MPDCCFLERAAHFLETVPFDTKNESQFDIAIETEDNEQKEMTTLNPKYFPYDDQDIYELFLNYMDETEILDSVTESS